MVSQAGDVFPTHPVSPELAEAARILAKRARRTASICTGTFVLAAAGLLDGRRATTHWQHATTLARAHPAIEVEPDAIYVEDGPIFSSAGVSAGIDLGLALVEHDHGAGLARDGARSLVVFLQRPGGQSQFSPSLRAALPRSSPLRKLCDAVSPAGDYSLATLAALAHVSSRHLTRLFRDELKTTPARYVELIRFDIAKDLLDTGHSVPTPRCAADSAALRRCAARSSSISASHRAPTSNDSAAPSAAENVRGFATTASYVRSSQRRARCPSKPPS